MNTKLVVLYILFRGTIVLQCRDIGPHVGDTLAAGFLRASESGCVYRIGIQRFLFCVRAYMQIFNLITNIEFCSRCGVFQVFTQC